jgi:superoxide dismutase, Fe-Mn family
MKKTVITIFAFLLGLNIVSSQDQKETKGKVEFPPLPYAFDALEPYIDQKTMEIHYDRHHRAYYNNFIKGIQATEMEGMSMEKIFANMSKYPEGIRNNAGGHYNHVLFWSVMSPNGGGEPGMTNLKSAIEESFGSFEKFKTSLEDAARTRFGSGWAWLSVGKDGKLFVSSTPNQDNPLMDVVELRGTPILGLDVWEHAYYLKYQNLRADYISNFWNVVNWEEVNRRYEEATRK